jgi:PST family polysaccharide transporter
MSNRKQFQSGIFYNGFAKYSNVVINIFIMAILSRLLTPNEFGIVSISMVFITFFNLMGFFIQPAIIQNKTVTKVDLNSIFTFTLYLGIILSVLFFFLAPVISNFYNQPELLKINKLLSISVFFNIIVSVPQALASKNLKFRKIGTIGVIINLVGGIVAVVLAYMNLSYYALVIKNIIVGFLSFIFFYYGSELKFLFFVKKDALLKIKTFSINQFFITFTNYFSRNADNLLIGKYLGASELGYYDKAYRLMLMPVQNLSQVIAPVLHPVLAKHEKEPKVIYDFYSKVVGLLSLISFPFSAFLFFSAHEIINIVFGSQWNASIPAFKILSITISFQVILSTSGSIFKSLNRTDLMLIVNIISSILFVVGIVIGIWLGKTIESVGLAIVIVFVISFFTAFFFLIKKGLKLSLSKFLNIFSYPFMLMTLIGFVLYLFTETYNIHSMWYSLILKSLISLTIFIAFLFLSPKTKNLIFNLLRKKNNV